MIRHLTFGAVAAALLGIACPLPAGEKLYHLRKVPRFRVGDRAVEMQIQSGVSCVASGGKIVREIRGRKESHCIDEVLEVDKAGKVQALRVTIVSAKAHTTVKGMVSGKKDVAIEKIHFIARRKGLYFDADTTTVVSEKAAKLKASQIWLLKEFCREGISFAAYSEGDAMLLSARPVPVGHSWKPSRKVLDEWVKADPTAKAIGGKALSFELKLVSVKNDIALVKGDALLEAYLPGMKPKLKMPTVFTGYIDTASGRWTGGSSSGSLSRKSQGGTFKLSGWGEQTNTFTPGKGKASALPAKLFKLGWEPPGKDTNNHKDPAKGFSLNVPAGYAAKEVKPGGTVLVAFAGERGANIRVDDASPGLPVDGEEFVRDFQAGMRRRLRDYGIIERKDLILPGNVPAVLLVGQAFDAKVTILTVVALDGPRVLSATGAAQTANKRDLAEVRKALKTLRVFERDMTKAP